MTLKERILPLVADGSYVELTVRSIEKIADDFAVGFLNWYFDKGQWITKNLDVKGLLEIYKKEKGL